MTEERVLYNGNILTLDEENNTVQAVRIKNGLIQEAGSNKKILEKSKNVETIDLQGKTAIPGFVDAHTHVDLYGMMTSEYVVDCRMPPNRSVEEVLAKIREKADLLPEGEVILGQGRVAHPYPTQQQLDEAAPRHGVILKSSMHNYNLNSFALKKFGIDKEKPTFEELFRAVPASYIEREEETGKPTGYVEEAWNYLYPGSKSPLSYSQTRSCIKKGLEDLSRYGVTSVAEFTDFAESPRIYQELHRKGELKLRVQLIPCFHGLHKTVDLEEVIRLGLVTGFGNQWVKFGGVKMFVDLQQHTTCTTMELEDWFRRAHRAGVRMYMHAITKNGQDMTLKAIEAEAEATGLEGVRAMRHRIEHLGNENHDLEYLYRLKHLGAIGVPTAYFMNMGPYKLLSAGTDKVYLFKTMLEMGLCVPGNSDGAGAIPECFNPMYQIWCMVNRKAHDGQLVCPEEKVSVLEALRIYTNHSAYAGFEEAVKGSIEAGKYADFAVLSCNPLECPEEELRDIQVDMTLVGGKVVFSR